MAETVIVYCKIPNGFHLTVKAADGVDHTIRINGPVNKQASDVPVVFGHGATRIPKDFWDQWVKEHENFGPVEKGHIFAADKPASGRDMAKERKDNRCGLEGLDPKKPGHGLAPADEMKKVLDKLPSQDGLV